MCATSHYLSPVFDIMALIMFILKLSVKYFDIVYLIHVISFSTMFLANTKCEESKLGIPTQYDKLHKVNLSINIRDVDDFLKRGRLAGIHGNSGKHL